MYDLLLKGGTVVDPSTRLDGAHDVAVQGGQIARIAPDIPEAEAARTIDVAGKIVTPGLIDLHAHVFEGFNRTGVNPDLGGVLRGRHHDRRRGQRGLGDLRRVSRATSCRTAIPRSSPSCTSARPGSPRCPTSSRRAASTSTTR